MAVSASQNRLETTGNESASAPFCIVETDVKVLSIVNLASWRVVRVELRVCMLVCLCMRVCICM